MNKSKNKGTSLCKDCRFRFRRAFIITDPEDYFGDDEEINIEGDDNVIVITNICLLAGIDIDKDITFECNQYKPKTEDDEVVPFFKHL